MVILDTDHLSEMIRGSHAGRMLQQRLRDTTAQPLTTIVAVEEVLRGRFAQVSAASSLPKLVAAYGQLRESFMAIAAWRVLPFDLAASEALSRMRSKRIAVGTMDLRIAAITIANDARLLSRNLKDFGRVPDLKVEDWLS